METKTIDLNAVYDTLNTEFDIFEYIETEGPGVLRCDWGSGGSFWLYTHGTSVSGEMPPQSKKLKETLQNFGFTQFDWEPSF
jgi:hypothetical protein